MKKMLHFILPITLLFFLTAMLSLSAEQTNRESIYGAKQEISGELNNYSTLWGWRGAGDMGVGSIFPRFKPIQISTDSWMLASAGANFSLGIKSDSTLWVWGSNSWGQFGNGTPGDSSIIPEQIGTDHNYKYATAGVSSSFAIKSDGSLWAWGNNRFGLLGDSTDDMRTKPVRIGKGVLGKVKYISADYSYTAVITEDGSLWTWGYNKFGTLGDGTNTNRFYPAKIGNSTDWMTVCCGTGGTFALKTDGTLWAWGDNSQGELGDGSKINQNVPIQIGTDSDWASISSSGGTTFAIKKDGTLWAWGHNYYGELGDGTRIDRIIPTRIGKDTDWLFVLSNSYFSEAVKKDGTLWHWGYYYDEDIKNVDTILAPKKISNITKVTFLGNASGFHTLFLRDYKATLGAIETLPITKITSNSAEGGGNLTSAGSEEIYQRGVCYEIFSDPTIENKITEDGKSIGVFQSSMTKLQPYKKYYVRAYVRTAAGDSYGEVQRFFTKLPTPILISPKINEINVPLNTSFLWNKVENALKYSFQLSLYTDFKTKILDTIVQDSSLNFTKLNLGLDYFWRIEAINGTFTSDWSEIDSFQTIKFNKQQLLSPAKNDINIPIDCQLKWNQNAPGSSYILQVSKNQNLSDILIDTVVTDFNFKCKKLDFLQSYSWRVNCFKGSDSSGWSPVWNFTTLMDSVQLTSPIDLSKNIPLNQSLNWEKGIYGKNYRLQICKDESFVDLLADNSIIGQTTTDPKNLKYYTKYCWRVRNESGDTLGYWSKIWQFKTRIANLILIYPENHQTGLGQKINFVWSNVIGALYYHLQISKNEQFTDVVYSHDSITTTEYYVPDLENDVLYYWRVRPWNLESIGSLYWSDVWTYKTGTTGVSDEAVSIKIIPNPAGDFITINLGTINTSTDKINFTSSKKDPSLKRGVDGTSEISIYNTLGEKVMTVEKLHATSLQINISDFPRGMYFVRMGGETVKFFKL